MQKINFGSKKNLDSKIIYINTHVNKYKHVFQNIKMSKKRNYNHKGALI